MKKLNSIVLIALLVSVITSCSSKGDGITPIDSTIKKVTNLHALAKGQGIYTGKFTKFSFSEGKQVTSDNWDIAFRATEIIVNGGKKGVLSEDIDRIKTAALVLETGTFASIKQAPIDKEFKQDSDKELALPKGSDNGWYHYTGAPKHLIQPIKGRVLVVKTHNGHYAKMEILSYYKDDKPSATTSQYYTFNYVYNPIKGDKSFQ